MLVTDLIHENNLVADLTASDRTAAFSQMLQVLQLHGFIDQSLVPACLAGLLDRESKMTTAMGGGFALPHATVAKLPQPCFLLARSLAGVDCEAVDGKLVNIFFLILAPPEQSQAHLQILAAVAKFFNRRGLKSKLLQAAGTAEIFSLLRNP